LKPCGTWLRAEGAGLRERHKTKDTRYKKEGFVFIISN
jgi:hypothetical protein